MNYCYIIIAIELYIMNYYIYVIIAEYTINQW